MKMKEYYDRTYLPKHFVVGDKVLLRLCKGYNIPINDAYTKKLGQQYAGCFTVLERIGRLIYRIDIPAAWKIHPVISIEHLEPAPSLDPFDREAPILETTTDEGFLSDIDRCEVERVLDWRTRHPGRYRTPRTNYLIQ
ncbi:hypothetical protein ACN38_g12169 [Penicillium nordicum]|uniref:Tf2-1-like SH3-like domain-containing protein n=1 Tax=Penicillium nordicum TaxID=229535 RepID=A0A0M8NQ20_9EURO|nr:hypothetical protein ACN38_g12169 [Penicillium nordicum]